MSDPVFSICIYCGSRSGADAAFEAAAREVGAEIGRRGWQLVYGGGNVGLMGAVADAVLAHGGRVVGVIPRKLIEREVGHRNLHELHVVQTMHERKMMMAQRAQAFLALPGGIGTFEELFEAWTWRQLGYHDLPVGVLNVGGFYDRLIDFIDHTVRQGFLSPPQADVLQVGQNVGEMLDRLHRLASSATGPEDFRRI